MNLTPFVHVFFRTSIFGIFNHTHQLEKVWPGRNQPILLQNLSWVYITSFRSLAPRVSVAKVLFLALFLVWREHRRECGHIVPQTKLILCVCIYIYILFIYMCVCMGSWVQLPRSKYYSQSTIFGIFCLTRPKEYV